MINLHCRHIVRSRISEYTLVALKTSDLSKSIEFFCVESRSDMIELPLSSINDLLLGSLSNDWLSMHFSNISRQLRSFVPRCSFIFPGQIQTWATVLSLLLHPVFGMNFQRH